MVFLHLTYTRMKQINLLLVFFILVFALIPLFLSNKVDEKMTYEIQAPLGLVFDEFADLRQFSKWEKFTEQDSLTQKTFTPAEEGNKEFAEWKSKNSNVGNGRITIDAFEMNRSVDYKFKYEGWENEDNLAIDFEQTPAGTTQLNVHYISQEVPYFYRYFLYFNSPLKKVDQTIQTFNELVKIRLDKDRKEGRLNYGEFRIVKMPKQTLLALKKTPSLEEKDVTKKIDEAFESIYHALINEEDSYDFDLGFPHIYTSEINLKKKTQTIFAGISLIEDLPLQKGMQRVTIPEGEYLLTLHQGPRSKRSHTIQLMKKYAISKKIELGERELEVLLNDPKETDSLQLKSRIYLPIKSN